MDEVRRLYKLDPEKFNRKSLSEAMGVSVEAISRIIKARRDWIKGSGGEKDELDLTEQGDDGGVKTAEEFEDEILAELEGLKQDGKTDESTTPPRQPRTDATTTPAARDRKRHERRPSRRNDHNR